MHRPTPRGVFACTFKTSSVCCTRVRCADTHTHQALPQTNKQTGEPTNQKKKKTKQQTNEPTDTPIHTSRHPHIHISTQPHSHTATQPATPTNQPTKQSNKQKSKQTTIQSRVATFVTGEEFPLHSRELNHALSGGKTQSKAIAPHIVRTFHLRSTDYGGNILCQQ